MSTSLSRAFTTKRSIKPADISTPIPKRSLTTKHSFPSGLTPATIRSKISAPVELISTTNMLSYNAPDIYPSSNASASGDDSDRSQMDVSTPLTSPDTSSIESSPTSLEPNHLSCYFGTTSRQSASSGEAPVIPKRALSHTKQSAEALARKRSTSRMSSPKNSISSRVSSQKDSISSRVSSPSQSMSPTRVSLPKDSISSRVSSPKNSLSLARSSINMFAANIDTTEHHPFGNELAQVSEIAEEYGITEEKMSVIDKEEQELISRGLFKFCAEEYMSEIQALFLSAFGDAKPKMSTMWI